MCNKCQCREGEINNVNNENKVDPRVMTEERNQCEKPEKDLPNKNFFWL